MSAIGIDVGSTYTKYCVLGDGTELFSERTPVRQRAFFADRLQKLRAQYRDCMVVSCGYGRENVTGGHAVSELSALAAGVFHQAPGLEYVLDIGGQDTKLIRQEGGKIRAFFVNDKCAAGCGMFLSNTLHMLGLPFEKTDLTDGVLPGCRLSSTCAVFAQSEIVELIAEGVPEEEIVRAVVVQILTQARTLLGKVDCGSIGLSGGLTLIPGIEKYAEAVLERPVAIPENAAYLAAIGCARMAERS